MPLTRFNQALAEFAQSPASSLPGGGAVPGSVASLAEAYATKMPCVLLSDLATVSAEPCCKIMRRERLRRRGKYTYFTRGFDTEPIDDYTVDTPCLLVGCLGTARTQRYRLVVVRCLEKGIPSELFYVVTPHDPGNLNYLYHALCSTPATHLLSGNDLVEQLLLGSLKGVRIAWPGEDTRAFAVEVFEQLDALAQACKELAASRAAAAFTAVSKLREALGDLLVLPTSDIEMLRSGSDVAVDATAGGLKAQAIPSARELEAALVACQSKQEPGFAVLDLIDAIAQAAAPQATSICDVFAHTTALDKGWEHSKHPLSICIPPAQQELWTQGRPNSNDPRWVLGLPPRNKADYAWIMQVLFSLGNNGIGIMLLTNGPFVSMEGVEPQLRKALAASGLVQCVISLPGGVFSSPRAPSSILVLEKGREPACPTLFIDLQDKAELVGLVQGRSQRHLPPQEAAQAASVYAAWRGESGYQDLEGYCYLASPQDLASHDYSLAPWAYV